MSEELVHSIFHLADGGQSARSIKDFFSQRRYNVQFNLHDLQNANAAAVSNTGVTILLATPQVCHFIKSRKMFDLNAIFPFPEFSVVLFPQVENTKITELLSNRIKDFSKWTQFEYQENIALSTLGIRIMEIVERSEGWTPVPPLQKFWVWNREGVKSHKNLLLMFINTVDVNSNVKVVQEWDGLKVAAERLNPMTYSFTVGNVQPGERNIEVYVDDISFGKAVLHVESKIQEISKLLQNVINPIELMCRCFPIVPSTRDGLDRKMRDLLRSNTSSVSQIFDKLNWEQFGVSNSFCELPTLLHFGAKYGLVLFCKELLSLPGGKHAFKIKNKDGLLPHQIAEKEGFSYVFPDLQPSKKEPYYVHYPISPLEEHRKGYFNSGPETPTYNSGPSSITRNISSSSSSPPSTVQTPVPPPRHTNKTKSVRSSSDSGISVEAEATDS